MHQTVVWGKKIVMKYIRLNKLRETARLINLYHQVSFFLVPHTTRLESNVIPKGLDMC